MYTFALNHCLMSDVYDMSTTRSCLLASQLLMLQKTLCLLQEVYLLKRDPDSMVVEETWHIRGPFEGNTLNAPPVWPGSWLIDVLACIHDCQDNRSFWLKAMHRSVPSAPSDQ